ncbi:MAG: 30S ribosomal protein S5 [bacterium]
MDKEQQTSVPSERKQSGGPSRGGSRPGSRGPRGRRPEEKSEFDSRILDLARVTRVTKGGKRMRFRACIILGDRKGRVGYGVAKGADVQQAVNKATSKAKKVMISVPVAGGTVPHEVRRKFAAAQVMIKPAPEGTGVKAGGAVRVVLELAGVPNVVAKILGSNNKINNAKATMLALRGLKQVDSAKGGAGRSAKADGTSESVEQKSE